MQLLKKSTAAKKSAAAAPQSESLHVSYFTVLGTSAMAHATTLHALDRRSQREIRGDFIELCKACGTRTNVPNGGLDNPNNTWRYKYMYHGLHVIAEPASGKTVTAYWTSSDVEIMQRCRDWFARTVEKRKAETHRRKMENRNPKDKKRHGSHRRESSKHGHA